MWSPSIMAYISAKELNPEIRNEIVRDLVPHMYASLSEVDQKPTARFSRHQVSFRG